MKLPAFNPREIPSHPLSELDSSPSMHEWRSYSKKWIQDALLLQSNDTFAALIVDGFQNHDVPLLTESLRPAAVLIMLIEREHDLDVVLTVRAHHLRHHAGQVSFVGGAVDTSETALEASLREAKEEIGLDTSVLEVLGQLPIYHTITGFAVTPIVAILTERAWRMQQLRIATQEVERLFTVPLSVLLNPDNIYVHEYEWDNQTRRYYSVTYEEYFIWGASMAMLHNLGLLLREACYESHNQRI